MGGPLTSTLLIRGLQLYGHHGWHPEERERGQLFAVDIELGVRLAGPEDELAATVDQEEIIREVQALSERSSFKLIESFARAIAEEILAKFDRVERAQVRVRKLHPPLSPGAAVEWLGAEVIQERTREAIDIPSEREKEKEG